MITKDDLHSLGIDLMDYELEEINDLIRNRIGDIESQIKEIFAKAVESND